VNERYQCAVDGFVVFEVGIFSIRCVFQEVAIGHNDEESAFTDIVSGTPTVAAVPLIFAGFSIFESALIVAVVEYQSTVIANAEVWISVGVVTGIRWFVGKHVI